MCAFTPLRSSTALALHGVASLIVLFVTVTLTVGGSFIQASVCFATLPCSSWTPAAMMPAPQISASLFNMSLEHALQMGSATGRLACPLMTPPPSQAFKAKTCLSETPTRLSETHTCLPHNLVEAGTNQHVSALATVMATEVIQSGFSQDLTLLPPACSAQKFP